MVFTRYAKHHHPFIAPWLRMRDRTNQSSQSPSKSNGRNTDLASGVLGVFVAEEVLDHAKLGAAIGQVEAERMTQLVWVEVGQSSMLPRSRTRHARLVAFLAPIRPTTEAYQSAP